MSKNLRLPTSHSQNWGSGLNAYLESLNTRISSIENSFIKANISGARTMQNIGASSSGLVGTRTIIKHITDDSSDIIEISQLSAYVGGDVLTYFEQPTDTIYQLVSKGETAYEPTKKVSWTPQNNVAYYVYLQYDIIEEDFVIGFDVYFNSFNYSQILIGIYFNGNFTPFYMSNLKSIPQHIEEFQNARIDLDEYNIGLSVKLYDNKVPEIWLGTAVLNEETVDEKGNTVQHNSLNPIIDSYSGPVMYLNGIGYSTELEPVSKWYGNYDQLNKKMLSMIKSDTKILYLYDIIDTTSGSNKIKTAILNVDDNTTDEYKLYLPYTENYNTTSYNPSGHYYRILLSVIDNLIIVQKSSDNTFMNSIHYDLREQNLYNIKFNNVFLQNDAEGSISLGDDNHYSLALDALFCVEIGRFCINDLIDSTESKEYSYTETGGEPDDDKGLQYITSTINYPNKLISMQHIVHKMEATSTQSGLYGTSTIDGITSATIGDLCYVQENETMWKCSKTVSENTLVTNFFEYWTFIRPTTGASSLSHNFTFVPALNNGIGSQMKWNVWQTKQGRINFNYIDIGSTNTDLTSQLLLDIKRPNYTLNIDFDDLLPFSESLDDGEKQENRFLFEKYASRGNIFLSSTNGFQLHNDVAHDTKDEEAPNNYLKYTSGTDKTEGILIANHNESYAFKITSASGLILKSDTMLRLESGWRMKKQIGSMTSLGKTETDEQGTIVPNALEEQIFGSALYKWYLPNYKKSPFKIYNLEMFTESNTVQHGAFGINISEHTIKDSDNNDITVMLATCNTSFLLTGDNYIEVQSDRRLKDNIQKYDKTALQIVNQVPVVTFNYKNSSVKTLGVIAQDLEQAVSNDNFFVSVSPQQDIADARSLRENKLIYILWKAVQELTAELNEIKNKVA